MVERRDETARAMPGPAPMMRRDFVVGVDIWAEIVVLKVRFKLDEGEEMGCECVRYLY